MDEPNFLLVVPEMLYGGIVTFDDCPDRKWVIRELRCFSRTAEGYGETEFLHLVIFPVDQQKGIVERRTVTILSSRITVADVDAEKITVAFREKDGSDSALCIFPGACDKFQIYVMHI